MTAADEHTPEHARVSPTAEAHADSVELELYKLAVEMADRVSAR